MKLALWSLRSSSRSPVVQAMMKQNLWTLLFEAGHVSEQGYNILEICNPNLKICKISISQEMMRHWNNLGLCSAGFFLVATLATKQASWNIFLWKSITLIVRSLFLKLNYYCHIWCGSNLVVTLKWPQSSILIQQPTREKHRLFIKIVCRPHLNDWRWEKMINLCEMELPMKTRNRQEVPQRAPGTATAAKRSCRTASLSFLFVIVIRGTKTRCEHWQKIFGPLTSQLESE